MTIRVVIALSDKAIEASVVRRLARADTGATVVRRCLDVVELRAVAAAGLADVAVVELHLRGMDRDVVRELHSHGLRVVGISLEAGNATLGVDAVVPPKPEHICTALRGGQVAIGIDDPTLLAPDEALTGNLMTVWGPIGAPGRTSIAVAIADELALLSLPTLLADVDTYGPSVAQHLGLLDDSSGVAAVCRLAGQGRLDGTAVVRSAVALPSGLRVLTGIPRTERWEELRPAALDLLWQHSRSFAASTVADIGFCVEQDELAWFEPGMPSRNQAAVATLAAADTLVAVTSADPVGLTRFLRQAPLVRELAPAASFNVVVNRMPKGRQPESEVRALLREHLDVHTATFVPDSSVLFASCRQAGRTLSEVAPRSEARRQLRGLAAQVAGVRLSRKRRRAA